MSSKIALQRTRWFDEVDIWSAPVLANLLWFLLCLPLITTPLAFVGLFGVMFHWMKDRRTQVFSIFFGTIRRTWQKCYLLLIMDILVLGLVTFNLFMFQLMDMGDVVAFLSRSVTLLTLIFFVIVNVLAWVLIAVWDAPLKKLLVFALRLVFIQPVWSLGIAVLFCLPFLISLVLPVAVLVTMTGAVAAYLASWGTFHLLKQYLPSDEFCKLDIP